MAPGSPLLLKAGSGGWQATVRVGTEWLSMGITVLEAGGMDCLFGLDMLRRYACSIDLKANVLRFQSLDNAPELPFLAEHELPDSARLNFAPPPGNGECTGRCQSPWRALCKS